MTFIKRITKIEGKDVFIDDLKINSDYCDYKQNEFVILIEKDSIVTEGFAKQFTLHRTKAIKHNDSFLLKEDVALPVRLVFPTEPNVKDDKGMKRRIPLVEGDYDFSDLLGIKKYEQIQIENNEFADSDSEQISHTDNTENYKQHNGKSKRKNKQ